GPSAAGHVPEPDEPVNAPAGQRGTVGAEGHGPHFTAVAGEVADGLARSRVPQGDLTALLGDAGAGQDFAVRAEGHGKDNGRMTCNLALIHARDWIPEGNDLEAAGGKGLPVATERQRGHRPVLLPEGAKFLTGRDVPQFEFST